jgi:hypothetical protein
VKLSVGFKNIGLISIETKKTFLYFFVFFPFSVWGKGENWHDNLVFDFGFGCFFRIINYKV